MKKIDILSRDIFVEQLVQLTESMANNKRNISFAIDGKWGSGKSFVLDMFEEKLSIIQSDESKNDKYFIVRYNCWKYDYYDEPLVAIVASILEAIEQKTKILKKETRAKINGVLRAIGTTLLSLTNGAIKEKTGVDINAAFNVVKKGLDAGENDLKTMHDYDVYFSFNKALESLQNVLASISEEHTIVFLIDELDRCIPEYSIKVLERLHHLTEHASNTISVISIDKAQLQKSVTKSFGFENTNEYLKKFLQFTISLNIGEISTEITDKYADYISLFDKEKFPFKDSFEEFLQNLFEGIDVRTQEQLVNKAFLVHNLLFKDKKDYTFLCMELLLTVLISVYNCNACFKKFERNLDFKTIFNSPELSLSIHITNFLAEEFKSIQYPRSFGSGNKETYLIPNTPFLYGAILYSWYWMNDGWSNVTFSIQNGGVYEPIKNNHEELKKFAEIMRLIKD